MTKTKHPRIKMEFDGKATWYYTLSTSCDILSKARSTLMRLLPTWEEITGYTPKKDHSNRWLIPTKSLHKLRDDPDLYLQLAGRATKWEQDYKGLQDELHSLKRALKRKKCRSCGGTP